MKLAKKVLSVVLAMVLALSAFAVVGSANGDPDTATHHAKVWLTGSAGSAVWSSNAKVTITEGDESEAGGTLEVQPGDHVFVRLYATNDYYVHTFQANLFYSAELIDGYEDYFVQRPSASSFSAANQKKIHIWNTNNEWAAAQGTSYSAQNFWTYQNDTFNADVEQNWPTDDEGNNLFNMEEWKFNRLNNLVSENSGWTNIWEDTDNHLIMMTLKVPEDAQPGDTFYVTIPEGTEQREAKPKGALRLYENGVCADCEEPCEVVDTQSSLNPNMKYGDEYLYWDLSEATLTLVIPGETTTIDYSALEAKITEAKAVDTSNATTASADALAAAITAAQAMVDGQTASSQDDVTSMITTLDEAIAAVENLADYTALNEALAEYATLNSADWTTDTWAAVEEAYATASAIEEGLGASQQGTIDAAATALATAIDNLAPNLDYSALEAKVNEVKDTDTSIYTVDTAGRFNNALAFAQNMVDNKTATSQDDITNALAELTNSHAGLTEKDADYTALTAAKDAFVALNEADWTKASYANAKAAYDEACAVAEGLKYSDQGIIDAAATALNDAITALVPATGADYSALDKAIETAKALVADHYTTDSYAAVETALAAAEAVARDLTSEDQATIDEAETALTTALGALVEADADYTAVNTAITAAQAKVAENDEGTLRYADEWIAEVNAAVEAVVEGLKKKDQATVDGYATAINALLDAPVYRAYDYTAINDHIAAIEANPVDYYNADSYAAYLAKKEALVWDYTHEQYAKAKLQEIQFLKVTVDAAAAADYTEVEAAQAEFEALDETKYTPESYAAVKAAVDAVDWDLNENYQAQVDAYAEAINTALDNLEEVVIDYADYTALDAAIADAANYAAADYTVVSYTALTDAVAAGNAVARDLLVADQAIVDDAAKAITDAIAALEKKADYTALDAAIAEGDGYDPNVWSEETYSVLADAVAAGRAVDRNLGESSQSVIDAATKAITDAIAGLKEKEVKSKIMTINWTPSEDTHNTFTVSVEDRPAMIQFIEKDGGTRTYDRYNKNVTIVSYNADGVEVNSLDRSVAYEVWTITTNLIGPDVKARAKYLSGTSYIWETETYNFTVEVLEPTYDASVRSIGPAATSGKKGAVSTVVITGPDAQAIRFVMDNNTTTTYSADKAYVLANGDLMFTGNAWMNNDGLNIVKVQIKVAGVWTDAGTVEYTVE
ncbi:MAG: hypothetical protein IJ447_08925 [Clostridia bacterium]|nr:hypothetical protein [Clostridia bacterium]